MKYFLLPVFFLLYIISTGAQGVWTELNATGITQPASQLPHNLGAASGFTAGGKAFFGTGVYDHLFFGFATTDFYSYDPSTNKWQPSVSLPASGRYYSLSFELSGYGYIGLGMDGEIPATYSDLWKYDHLTGSWTQQANFPGPLRRGFASFCINDKGYVIGGQKADTIPYVFFNDTWEYDPIANSWLQKSDFPLNGISNGAGFSVNFYGYLTCVFNSGYTHQTTYRYSQVTDSWDTVATFPANWTTLAFSMMGNGYVMDHSTLYQYNPANDSWATKSPAPFNVNTNFAVIMNNLAWLLFPYGDVYTYDPSGDAWNHVYTSPAFYNEYFGHAIVIGDTAYSGMWKYDFASDFWSVDSGFVNTSWLFSIGNSGYAFRDSAFKVFDQINSTWSTLPSVSLHTASVYFALNGKGYFGLGTDSLVPAGNSFYEYDPASSTWTRKADIPYTTYNPASFAIMNKGYVAGGVDSTFDTSSQFWEYDPASDTWSQKTSTTYRCMGCIGIEYNGKGYYGFGVGESDGGPDYPYFNSYDPVSDTWSPNITNPVGGHDAVGFAKGNKMYLGRSAIYYSHPYSDRQYDFWSYDEYAGVTENEIESIRIYPSITSENIFIKSSSQISSLTVFNSSGMKMNLKSELRMKSEIDISALSQGIYFLKIETRNGSAVRKFIRK